MTSPESMRRVLLVRTSHLGDCVRALPLARALLEQRPDATVGWAIQPEYAPLLEGLGTRGRSLEILSVPRREGPAGTWRGLRRVRAFAPDWVVDAQGNAKSALIVAASRAAVRLGPEARHCREAFAGRVALNRRASSSPQAPPHALDRIGELAADLGLELEGVACGPQLSAAELEVARGRVDRRFGHEPPRLAYVAASGDERSWPFGRWRELLERCVERGRPVAFHGGPREVALLQRLADGIPKSSPVHARVEPLPIRDFAALASACAERGGRLLGTDTGPTHLAASAGLAVAQLSGPTDPRRTGVWPDPARDAESPHRIVGYDPAWRPGETHLESDWAWPGPPAADAGVEQALSAWLDD